MLTVEQLRSFIRVSAQVCSENREEIGTVHGLYIHEPTGTVVWALVKMGHFDHAGSLVPLDQAQLTDDLLLVPFGKRLVKDAPQINPGPYLHPADEDLLYDFYAIDTEAYDGSESTAQPDPTADNPLPVAQTRTPGSSPKKLLTVHPPKPQHPGEIIHDTGTANDQS